MGREVSYEDAVKLLGGDTAKIVKLVDTLTGVGLLALVGPFREVLGWFDAKAELSKITERLVTGLAEKRSKLSRYERTERLQAAHAALAITAFFEVMAETTVPLHYADLELTAEEQKSIGRTNEPHLGWHAPVPGPAESHEEFRVRLIDFYQKRLANRVAAFVTGLQAGERLGDRDRERFQVRLKALCPAAADRFDSLLGHLAAEFPEVAFWAGMREQNAAHARLREVRTGLAELRGVLDSIAGGRLPDDRRNALALRYAAALRRPIAESGEVPAGLRVPLLGDAFLPQLFRAVVVGDDVRLSQEDWWEQQPVRDDLLAFLTGHLTSAAATTAPLLILGQPGSGKSVLAKILAGQLPPTDFLPVLVALRVVHAAADVQDQIELAIRADTGERIDWPALSRSSGDALPVVILDGFDELLQATGVTQTDYLSRVVAFQRREAELGRPVTVIVTSRTSVADRAATPAESVAVRLEPFDADRVAAWLGIWNTANAVHFASSPDRAIDLATIMRYPDLAGQPLLLLMLALYDAEGNALRSTGDLRPDELYERLLKRFARREVEKLRPGAPPPELEQMVETQLRRLSVVAFAMFNRGAQWVREAELDADLRALSDLTDSTSAPAGPTGFRVPLRAAELALGSFFFVHRAGAHQDGVALETYEFLHATFGEFLVARLVHGVVRSLVDRERASSFRSRVLDDDLLFALISFAPLAGRRQAVTFLETLVGAMPAEDRASWADLIVRIFQASTMPRPPRAYESYLPRTWPVPARLSAYTANLLLLALSAGRVTASRLFGRPPVVAWREVCQLWRSQRDASGWSGLVDLVAVDRIRPEGVLDIGLSLAGSSAPPAGSVDLSWSFEARPGETVVIVGQPLALVRREAHFMGDPLGDFQQHILAPILASELDRADDRVDLSAEAGNETALAAFLWAVAGPGGQRADREARYLNLLDWAGQHSLMADRLLRMVETDPDVGLPCVNTILRALMQSELRETLRYQLARCVLAHLDPTADPAAVQELESFFESLLPHDIPTWTEVDLEAAIRITELGLSRFPIRPDDVRLLQKRYGAKRPDLAGRISVLTDTSYGGPGGMPGPSADDPVSG